MSAEIQSSSHVSISPHPVAQDTANLLKYGWRCVLVGWALPIIPVIGMLLLAIVAVIGQVIGVIAMVRGNASGGLKLLLVAMFGSIAVGLGWALVYAVVAALLS
jgi:hypothetical protein